MGAKSLSIAETTKVSALATVTTVPAQVAGDATYRIFSDRNIHVSIAGAATANDFPIAANCPEYISGVQPGASFSFIKGTGETDGTIWVTRVSLQH